LFQLPLLKEYKCLINMYLREMKTIKKKKVNVTLLYREVFFSRPMNNINILAIKIAISSLKNV
jgi:hypothetical protein